MSQYRPHVVVPGVSDTVIESSRPTEFDEAAARIREVWRPEAAPELETKYFAVFSIIQPQYEQQPIHVVDLLPERAFGERPEPSIDYPLKANRWTMTLVIGTSHL